MSHPNLFDALFGLALLLGVLLGCRHGNGKETLHTFLFGLSLLAGWLFLRSGELPTTQAELARIAVGIGFYAFAMYVFCWALQGVLAPLMLDGLPVGLRSRFWAGAQAIVKLLLIVLGVNLWYAAHSTATVGARLTPLPPLLHEAILIKLSDRLTEDTHRWLARHDFIAYQYTSGTIPPPTWEEPLPHTLTPMEPVQSSE